MEDINIRIKSSGRTVAATIQKDFLGSLDDFKEKISSILAMDVNCEDFDILRGFPPKPLQNEELLQLTSNEVIIIQMKELIGKQTTVPSKKRHKSMSMSSSSNSNELRSRSNVHTLSSFSGSSKQFERNNGVQRIHSLNSCRKKSFQNKKRQSVSTKDIASELIVAVSASVKKGSIEALMKKDFSDAVAFRYEEAMALARVNSVLMGKFSLNESQIGHLRVVFRKGLGYRVEEVENVELLDVATIKSTLLVALTDPEGNGRDLLIPRNLAKASPRIFWSLIFHFGSNLMDTYQSLFPNVSDWNWVEERQRTLSTKALDNLKQLQEKERLKIEKQNRKTQRINQDIKPYIVNVDMIHQLIADAIKSINCETLFSFEMTTLLNKVSPGWTIETVANFDATISTLLKFKTAEVALTDTTVISMQALELWISSAQREIIGILWCKLVLGGSERLRRLLFRLEYHSLSKLISQIGALTRIEFDTQLNSIDSKLEVFEMLLGTEKRKGNAISIWIFDTCSVINAKFPWIMNMAFDEEEATVLYEGETLESLISNASIASSMNNLKLSLQQDGWQFEGENSYVGKAVRILVHTDDEDLVEEWWTDGYIFCYLPPSDLEPMALWKVIVCLDGISPSEDHRSTVWFEDLEKHELEEALSRTHSN